MPTRIERKHGVILLDDEDAWITRDYQVIGDRRKRDGYLRVTVVCKKTKRATGLARLILGITDPELQADHINQDGFDNRRENLRVVGRDLQSANRRFNNSNGYKGVHYNSRGGHSPYRGALRRHGTKFFGPYRPSPEQAALDYNRMAIALWGQQIFLNDVRCVAIDRKPAQQNCLFCNAPCHCCCVCYDPPSSGMERLFESIEASSLV